LFSWYQALWIISAVLTLFIGPLPTLSAALLNLCLYYCIISSKQLQYNKANANTKQKGKISMRYPKKDTHYFSF